MLISFKEINLNVKRFIEAAKNGHGTVVEEMLSNGMLVDKSAEHGYTALMLATYTDKKEVISLWIKWGADVDKQDHIGSTALHWTACRNLPDAIKTLIEEVGASTKIKDNNNHTPLELSREYKRNHGTLLLEKLT